jgi:acid phosphatase type 7
MRLHVVRRRRWLAALLNALPPHGPRRVVVVAVVAAAAVAALAGGVLAATHDLANSNPWPYAQTERSPVLAVVGDISCQPGSPVESEKTSDVCNATRNQAQTATANQIEAIKPDLVAILGDEQYQVGRYEDFMGSYNPTYGAFKFLQRPTPGNHEFYANHGETGVHGDGYFDYYNGFQLNPDGSPVVDAFTGTTGTFVQPRPRQSGQAGQVGVNGDGWYSYDLGSWHIISLNAECSVQPGGCSPTGSWFASETQWLAQDLASSHAQCTLAYWHQPTFNISEGPVSSAEGEAADAWWQLLYQHGADVVLNGHDHDYTRFAAMDPSGQLDAKKGIREFIVGTGGEGLDTVIPSTPNVEAVTGDFYGVMTLTLNHDSYNWDFESALKSATASGALPPSYSDTGSARCHGPADR